MFFIRAWFKADLNLKTFPIKMYIFKILEKNPCL